MDKTKELLRMAQRAYRAVFEVDPPECYLMTDEQYTLYLRYQITAYKMFKELPWGLQNDKQTNERWI